MIYCLLVKDIYFIYIIYMVVIVPTTFSNYISLSLHLNELKVLQDVSLL